MNLLKNRINVFKKNYLFSISLIISCLLHAVVILTIPSLEAIKKTAHPKDAVKITISLSAYKKPEVAKRKESGEPIPETDHDKSVSKTESVAASQSKTPPTVNKKSLIQKTNNLTRKDSKPKVRRSLDLTYKPKEDPYWGKGSSELSKGGITENGAVIFNGKLFDAIQKAGKHSGYIPSGGLDATGFSGGRPTTFVKIGYRCFNVTDANPLDSLSSETWIQVAC